MEIGNKIDLNTWKGAIFSENGKYRYALWRIWNKKCQPLLFIGLNPSTANQIRSDPTVTRMMARATRGGFGGLLVGNLYAIVSSNPKVLLSDDEPIGLETNAYLKTMIEIAQGKALCGWGSFPATKKREQDVFKMIPKPLCLGINSDGQPKHPLYIGYDIPMVKLEKKTIMKTIILAGGRGTRLGQQSEIIPKPMVLIGNRPILWHIMKIYSCQGFNEFIICLGEKAHIIKDYFSSYESHYRDFTLDIANGKIEYHNEHTEPDWKVTLVDTGQDTLKGGRIKRIEKYLDSETNMLTYGDGLCDIHLHTLLEFHKAHGKMVTITAVRQPARFGELDLKDNNIFSFSEKPLQTNRLINGGFMVFNREMLDYLTEDKDCDFEIGVLDKLAREGQVMAYKHDGNWECLDHERDVIFLNELWKTKPFWKMYE